MWLTPESQVSKDRVSPILLPHVRYRNCPDRSDPKVGFLFVGWVQLAHLDYIRAYAVTGKKKWIAGVLYSIFTVQLGIAIYLVVWSIGSPGQYFHSIARISLSTKRYIPVFRFPPIPFDAYRACLVVPAKHWILFMIFTSLTFGNHLLTFTRLTTPRAEPLSLYLRRRCFRSRHYPSADHQIKVSRDEWAEHAQKAQQGLGDILRVHRCVPSRGRDNFQCGGGRIITLDRPSSKHADRWFRIPSQEYRPFPLCKPPSQIQLEKFVVF